MIIVEAVAGRMVQDGMGARRMIHSSSSLALSPGQEDVGSCTVRETICQIAVPVDFVGASGGRACVDDWTGTEQLEGDRLKGAELPGSQLPLSEAVFVWSLELIVPILSEFAPILCFGMLPGVLSISGHRSSQVHHGAREPPFTTLRRDWVVHNCRATSGNLFKFSHRDHARTMFPTAVDKNIVIRGH